MDEMMSLILPPLSAIPYRKCACGGKICLFVHLCVYEDAASVCFCPSYRRAWKQTIEYVDTHMIIKMQEIASSTIVLDETGWKGSLQRKIGKYHRK